MVACADDYINKSVYAFNHLVAYFCFYMWCIHIILKMLITRYTPSEVSKRNAAIVNCERGENRNGYEFGDLNWETDKQQLIT